jgi:Haem utilisation ChuX/HutX
MAVSFVLPGSRFETIVSGARLLDAGALAARCGDDVVRLRPLWPAIIAATRFARRTRWVFGNAAATLECVDSQPKRWLNQRAVGDPVQVHFDLAHWSSAYARSEGRMREIDVFAADGSAIAAVRLDEVDDSLDELIWLLVDDDQRRVLTIPPRRPNLTRPFAPGALCNALLTAFDAGLPLQVRLENAGGSVLWAPCDAAVTERDACLELRSALGRLTIGDRRAGIWSVRDGILEARSTGEACWLQIALVKAVPRQRLVWSGICASLSSK